MARVDISDPVLFCGDPPINTPSNASVTITAENAPSSCDRFYGDTKHLLFGCTIGTGAGQPNGLRAFYTSSWRVADHSKCASSKAHSEIFRQAILRLSGTPCPPRIDLVGGTGLAILTSPNGGELFSTCDSVTITWAGVLPTQPVKLEYSTDGGNSWNLISNNATGFAYNWAPPQAGSNYKIRVSVEPTDQYQWAEGIGGTGDETATAVAVSSDNVRVYTTGYFDGPFKAGSTTANSAPGNVDGYMIEWTADGNITQTTLLTGSGSSQDRVMGTVTDNETNVYIAGDFASPSATFGTQNMAKVGADVSNCFIFKYDQNGSIQWTNYARGDGLNTCTAECTNIGFREQNGATLVMLVGRFKRFVPRWAALQRSVGTVPHVQRHPVAKLLGGLR